MRRLCSASIGSVFGRFTEVGSEGAQLGKVHEPIGAGAAVLQDQQGGGQELILGLASPASGLSSRVLQLIRKARSLS